MILLDTNVVSEAMKPEPYPSVRDWLDAQGGGRGGLENLDSRLSGVSA